MIGAVVPRARVVLTAFVGALVLPAVALAASSAPKLGTDAGAVDLRAVEGAVPYAGGWAIPLKSSTPSWYTAELARKVEGSSQPVAAPIDAPLPSEVGIRPGSWMIAPAGCTMNFVFQKQGQYAIGTAGHCGSVGESVVLLTLAPGTANPVLVEVGTISISHDNGVGDDFALVPIKPELNSWVSPTIAIVGGPCGAYSGSGPETVWHYGHGLAIGTGGTPRAGVALTWKMNEFGWDGAAIFGDSGSPVRVTDLKAAGDLTHLIVSSKYLPSFIVGTRIQKMLSITGGYSLANSPLCPGGVR